MAPFEKTSIVMLAAAVAVAILWPTVSESSVCPGDYVYPFLSECNSPARYYGEEVYELEGYFGGERLAPEWDDTNSTYYVRLVEAGHGATYKFVYWITREHRFAVEQSHDVGIVNVETGRYLGWRQEAEDEWFLVEAGEPFQFQFANYIGSLIPCILPLPPLSCDVYNILNFGTSLGLSPYVEDNATYFKLSQLSETFVFSLVKISTATAVAN